MLDILTPTSLLSAGPDVHVIEAELEDPLSEKFSS